MAKYKLLSTKKLDPSVAKQLSRDFELTEEEFISIKPLLTEQKTKEVLQLAEEKKFVAFTSAHAVEIVDKLLQSGNREADWKIFSLSGRTKQAIEKARCIKKQISGEAENALSLAKKIAGAKLPEIIFFCGKQRREELPFFLKDAGVSVDELIVYETSEQPISMEDDFQGILFFSPSAVKSFFSVNRIKGSTVCFAIGKTTAETIKEYTNNRIETSEEPGQEKMVERVRDFFQNTKR